jgi:NH3-dependent NAD+ synthetase
MVASDFLSRLKMSIMYYYSDTYDHIVCTSVNRSDFLLGGATLWGECSGDLFPLISVYKTQVDMVARLLRIGFMVDPRDNFVPHFSSGSETSYYDIDPVLVGTEEGWTDDEINEDLGVDLKTISLVREKSECCRGIRGRAIETWLRIDSTAPED